MHSKRNNFSTVRVPEQDSVCFQILWELSTSFEWENIDGLVNKLHHVCNQAQFSLGCCGQYFLVQFSLLASGAILGQLDTQFKVTERLLKEDPLFAGPRLPNRASNNLLSQLCLHKDVTIY